MNLKGRLIKLEASAGTGKALFDMTAEDIERFVLSRLKLPAGTPITDDMLWKIIGDGETVISSITHEEALDLMSEGA
jgi:hypothetical protein